MKTHPIQLDRERELRFDSKAMRRLDMELTREYGKSMMAFLNGLSEERFRNGTADVNLDVLVRALRCGLAHERRLTDDQVCELIDAAQSNEMSLWNAVVEAYIDARGLKRQGPDEDTREEQRDDPPGPQAVEA